MVLMLNPRVGLISSMSSPLNFFTIVVFPALSSPLWFMSAVKQERGKIRLMHIALITPANFRSGFAPCKFRMQEKGFLAKGEGAGETYTMRILISRSFWRTFFRIESSPIFFSPPLALTNNLRIGFWGG